MLPLPLSSPVGTVTRSADKHGFAHSGEAESTIQHHGVWLQGQATATIPAVWSCAGLFVRHHLLSLIDNTMKDIFLL